MNKRKAVYIFLAALALLCFQILYYKLTVVMLQTFVNHFPGWSNDCYLMVHHFFQFIMLFIPTIIIHRHSRIDFGYHIKDWKRGLGWFYVGVAVEFLFNVIPDWIRGGFGFSFQADSFIFQFLFSGLGEEIDYRVLPLVILSVVWGQELTCKVGSKYTIDIDVLISALLFAIGHVGFGYNWISLLFVFAIGVVLGKIYRKTNSVWMCMIAHGIFNVIATTL